MKVTIVGRQMSVYEEMKALIEKKLERLDKYFTGEGVATVTLSCKHGEKYMEITISAAGTLFRSEVGAENFKDALDGCIDTIIRQIRKNKTRLAKRIREIPAEEWIPEEEPEEEQPILRVKTFAFKPMSPDEAILEMNLLGHQFFVFNDDSTGKTCVVYRRNDGGYGIITPE